MDILNGFYAVPVDFFIAHSFCAFRNMAELFFCCQPQ